MACAVSIFSTHLAIVLCGYIYTQDCFTITPLILVSQTRRYCYGNLVVLPMTSSRIFGRTGFLGCKLLGEVSCCLLGSSIAFSLRSSPFGSSSPRLLPFLQPRLHARHVTVSFLDKFGAKTVYCTPFPGLPPSLYINVHTPHSHCCYGIHLIHFGQLTVHVCKTEPRKAWEGGQQCSWQHC